MNNLNRMRLYILEKNFGDFSELCAVYAKNLQSARKILDNKCKMKLDSENNIIIDDENFTTQLT